ncbi:MAG: alpha/beta hydrolase [Clostridia bacterium]|nr:alpha/beta hydrolase [Clostridia bacterium]MBQ2201628.1 alpha/beta hydrolase [Clostridia bacterium]
MRNRIIPAALAVLLSVCGCAKPEPPKETLVKTVTIGGTEMDYLHFGNENGEKLVILPGLALKSVTGSAEGIVFAYALLAKDYDVYLFDHIKEEPDGYTVADMARDTLAVFDTLGLTRVHLMGVSMGGMVAQRIAIDAPERVTSLILCSTAMNMTHSNREAFANWISFAEARNTPALMESFGETVYTPSFYAQYKDAIIASGEGAAERDFSNFLISVNAVLSFDVSDEIQKIACPVLVLGAEEDWALGVQASYDLAHALRCESYIYEGYGHAVYDEAPDFLDRIAAFLKGAVRQP